MKKAPELLPPPFLQVPTFQQTFSEWGRSSSLSEAIRPGDTHFWVNTWQSSGTTFPVGYDYKKLTEGLMPHHQAYQEWLIRLMPSFFFAGAEQQTGRKILEIGCADADEAMLFLQQHGALWEQHGQGIFEMHLLDIDTQLLTEAQHNLQNFNFNKIRIYLWQGDMADLDRGNYQCFARFPQETTPLIAFPQKYDCIYSQLTLHHYSWAALNRIFTIIYELLNEPGVFIYSDITYTGVEYYDAILWNEMLRRIEDIEDKPKRDFWLAHYITDSLFYRTRSNVLGALSNSGFSDADVIDCHCDLTTMLAIKREISDAERWGI